MTIFNFHGRQQTINSAPLQHDNVMYTSIPATRRVLILLAKATEGYLRGEYPSAAISELFDLGYHVTWHEAFKSIEVTMHINPEAPASTGKP